MMRSFWLGFVTLSLVSLAAGCRRDPCAPDPFEGDQGDPLGSDLGNLTDSPSTNLKYEMTLNAPDDIDVFHFNVLDQGSDGNPELEIWVRGQDSDQFILTVDYKCTADKMVQFECNGETIESDVDGDTGKICRMASSGELYMDINYDCEGALVDNTDSGFAIVTISRDNPPEACAAYDLEINTD